MTGSRTFSENEMAAQHRDQSKTNRGLRQVTPFAFTVFYSRLKARNSN